MKTANTRTKAVPDREYWINRVRDAIRPFGGGDLAGKGATVVGWNKHC